MEDARTVVAKLFWECKGGFGTGVHLPDVVGYRIEDCIRGVLYPDELRRCPKF